MFRWVAHTAELELEIEAPSQARVFEAAVEALSELADDRAGPPATHELELEADDEPALLLVEWLSELVYLGEVERFVPERVAELELRDGRLRARVEGHRGQPAHLVKGVTLHRLELRGDDTVGWRARVVLDV
jgi:SHS2 domain-containing protein